MERAAGAAWAGSTPAQLPVQQRPRHFGLGPAERVDAIASSGPTAAPKPSPAAPRIGGCGCARRGRSGPNDSRRAGGVSPLILPSVADRMRNQGADAPRSPEKFLLLSGAGARQRTARMQTTTDRIPVMGRPDRRGPATGVGGRRSRGGPGGGRRRAAAVAVPATPRAATRVSRWRRAGGGPGHRSAPGPRAASRTGVRPGVGRPGRRPDGPQLTQRPMSVSPRRKVSTRTSLRGPISMR